jgi:hypothetical protein
MEFLDPTNSRPRGPLISAAQSRLAGARLAYVSNGWNSMTRIGDHLERDLKAEYGLSEFVRYSVPRNMEPPGQLLDKIAQECDAAIVGIAN